MQTLFPTNPRPRHAYTLLWLGALSPDPQGRASNIEALIGVSERFDFREPDQCTILVTGKTLIPITMLSRLSSNVVWWTGDDKRAHWLEAPSPGESRSESRRKHIFRRTDLVLNFAERDQRIVSGSALGLDEVAPSDWLERTQFLALRGVITLSSTLTNRPQLTSELDFFIPCTEIVRYFYAASAPLLRYIFRGNAIVKPVGHRLKGVELYGSRFTKSANLPRTYTVNIGTDDYSYEQLRAITWNALRTFQKTGLAKIGARPPFVGRCYVRGHVRLFESNSRRFGLITRIDDCLRDRRDR